MLTALGDIHEFDGHLFFLLFVSAKHDLAETSDSKLLDDLVVI